MKPSSTKNSRLQGGLRSRGTTRPARANTPLVSVVTVVLNAKQKLAATAASVLNQGYDSIEYIVIDGGSSDGTVDLLRSLDASIEYWISEPDNGIAAAFNKGIAASRGELIGLLNAGDVYTPGAIAKAVNASLATAGCDVVCGGVRLLDPHREALECLPDVSRLDKEMSVFHPAVFVSRSAYERYGSFNEQFRYAMDYELLLRMSRGGARFCASTSVLAEMMLEGVSRVHWMEGLREVRAARAMHFSRGNVTWYHARAVAMNLLAETLKMTGLDFFYRAYWRSQNARRARQEQTRPVA